MTSLNWNPIQKNIKISGLVVWRRKKISKFVQRHNLLGTTYPLSIRAEKVEIEGCCRQADTIQYL